MSVLRRSWYVYYLGTKLPNFIHFSQLLQLIARPVQLLAIWSTEIQSKQPKFIFLDQVLTN